MIRGFSFYHPRGTDPTPHLAQASEQLTAIVDKCARAGLVYALEVEANLIGQNGRLMADLARRIVYAVLVLLGVNLATFILFFTVNTPDDMARMQLGARRVTPEAIEPPTMACQPSWRSTSAVRA